MFNKILKTILLLLAIGIILLLNTEKLKAQEPTIVINEVMWCGSTLSSSDEWIELKNISDTAINISNWQVENLGKSNSSVIIPENINTIIAPGDFFIISKFEKGDKSILDISSNFIAPNLSLANSDNGNLILKDDQDNIIDIAKGDIWPAGDNASKASMERIDYGSGLEMANWQTSYYKTNIIPGIENYATPRSENSPKIFSNPEINIELVNFINYENALEVNAKVIEATDGDTITVDINGLIKKLRLAGIDTPESAKSSIFKVNEPYYQEAKDFTIGNLLGEEVKILVSIDNNERYDNYNRLIGIVVLDDEIYNTKLISVGFAKTYYLENLTINSASWLELEDHARNQKIGIWNNFGSECIRINEFMPNPQGDDSQNEWIELYNQCDYAVNLKNWFIDDRDGGSYPYLINYDAIIEPNNYFVFYSSDTKIVLNNDEDEIRLFNSSLMLSDNIVYKSIFADNEVYVRCEDLWAKTIIATPGATNSCQQTNNQLEVISDLEDIKKETTVTVEGVVNSVPGNLAKQYFFIEDISAGVQIYSYNGLFPELAIGQKIKVTGILSKTNYLRIRIADQSNIAILGESTISPKLVSVNDIDRYLAGKLIKTIGTISKISGNTFYITDKGKEIKVEIRGPTGIKRPMMYLGQKVEISGILYQNSAGQLSILPRYLSDIALFPYEKAVLENIFKIYDYLLGNFVKIRGIISVPPGVISNLYFYIQDESAGVQIYFSKKNFPDLKIGDLIEVYGKITNAYNRIVIYNSNDIVIISGNNSVTALEIRDDIAKYLSKLVRVSGVVKNKKSNQLVIQSSNQEFTIYIKSTSKIKLTDIKKGDYVEIIGIVEKYQDTYRIIPRFTSDIYYQKLSSVTASVNKTNKTKKAVKGYSLEKILPKPIKYIEKYYSNAYNNKIALAKTIIFILQTILITIILYSDAKKFFYQ